MLSVQYLLDEKSFRIAVGWGVVSLSVGGGWGVGWGVITPFFGLELYIINISEPKLLI